MPEVVHATAGNALKIFTCFVPPLIISLPAPECIPLSVMYPDTVSVFIVLEVYGRVNVKVVLFDWPYIW